MKLYRLTAISVLSMAVAACTTTQPNPASCALAGALIGAGGGAAAATEIENDWDDPEDAAVAGAIGAVAGGIIGYGVCALMGGDTPAPPPPPPPAPEPVAAPQPVVDPCEGAVTLQGVNFDINKADIRPSAAVVLDGLASALARCPQSVVYVEAHTDSTGSSEYNQALSQRRARSVEGYLIDRGVSAAMLEAKGYGESQPIAPNETEAGRAQNRRVVLRPVE